MALVLDTGSLIAFERGDPNVAALLEAARRSGSRVVTSSGCVGQAWRTGGPRQAHLARLLAGADERPLDAAVSRKVGELCGRAKTSDVIDSHVASLARNGDVLLTSDPGDLKHLLRACGVRGEVVAC
jgi:predicted nucleic acid-binding protein